MSEFEFNSAETEELTSSAVTEMLHLSETEILENDSSDEYEEYEEYEEDRYIDEGSVPASVLGGLIGMFIALILCTAVYLIFDSMPYLLFFLFPLCTCFMSLVFKGSLNIGGLVCEIIFTALGIFTLPAFLSACHFVKVNGTSFLSVPLVALSEIGNSNFFTNFAFSSATVLPVLIAVIGLMASWQVLKLKKAKLYD